MNQTNTAPAPTKKPYAPPKLQVFGTIASLTMSLGMTTDWDATGMATGNTKTM